MAKAVTSYKQTSLSLGTRPRPVAVPPAEARVDPLRALRASLDSPLARNLSSGADLIQSRRQKSRELFPTMLPAFDALLSGGLHRGKLTELTGRRSSGRFAVVLASLASVTSCGEAAALIDVGDHLDPRLAAAAGVDLQRLLWVRPRTTRQAASAAEMLISTGFPLVVIDLGIHFRGRVHEAAWVRLARSAEARGTALLISSPFPVSATAAEIVIQAASVRPQWLGTGRAPRVLTAITSQLTVQKYRGHAPNHSESLTVVMDEELIGMERDQPQRRPERVSTPAAAPSVRLVG